jgi:mono/diheme cytochrome c family protein
MNGDIEGFLLLLGRPKTQKMYKGIYYTHLISVNVFLLIYIVKTFLLLTNKEESLVKFTKGIKVPEMIVSALFLITGIYMIITGQSLTTLQIIKIIIVFASIPVAVIGFKKRNKAMAILSLLMIIAAYGLAEVNKKHRLSNPVSEENVHPGAAVNGHDIFMANCTSCHGEDGKAGLSGAKDLSVSTLDLSAQQEIIKNGKAPMPGYSGVLTEEQIKAVAEYSATLRK